MKHIFTLFLILLIVPLTFAERVQIEGLYYNLDSDTNTAEVTYYSSSSSSNKSYVKGDLEIPNQVSYEDKVYSVTSIGEHAFYGCSSLTKVEIPNSVTSIGEDAFAWCSSLKSVEIPNSVTSIGEWAFGYCIRLISIDIPRYVTSIGKYAFISCSSVTSFEIPNSVTSIEAGTFEDCSGLTSVIIPTSVTSIDYAAFESCNSLTSVIIPNSVTYIANTAFDSCNGLIKSAYPSSIKNPFPRGTCISYPSDDAIIENGFIYSKNKETIYFTPLNLEGEFIIPNSVTSIGASAFYRCSGLTSVNIPNSVSSIGNGAFYGCSSLTKVDISDLEAWCNIDFENYSSNPLYCAHNLYLNEEFVTDLIIPETVNAIKNYAFYGCSVTSVEIPNSVTSIGDGAFYNCSSLTSVEFPNSVNSIRYAAFENCTGLTSVKIPNSVSSIGRSAFQNCSGLIDVEIPNSVTEINESTFQACSSLTSIDIPNSVTSIGDGAFYNCSSLTSVEFPNSVNSIGNSAFRDCSGLTNIDIPSSVISFGSAAFDGCGLIEIILESETPPSYYSTFSNYSQLATLTIPDEADITAYLVSDWGNFLNIAQSNGEKLFFDNDGIFKYRFIESRGEACLVSSVGYENMTSVSIPDRVVADRYGVESFYQVTGISLNAFKDCSKLTQVKLPANCEGIGSNAFSGCTGLTNVEIPTPVTYLGESAFSGCTGLSRVEIPTTVSYLGASAFSGCSNLTSVSIPGAITSIEDFTFYNCSGLTKLEVPDLVISIGTSAFEGCTGLTSAKIPNSVTSIGNSSFKDCAALTNMEIPNSVISIGDSSFQGCSGLTRVEIPKSVTSIGSSAFADCTGLTNMKLPYSVVNIGNEAFANIEFDNFSLEDAVDTLTWDGKNNTINAKNLYAGRNITGTVKYTGLETLEIGSFVESVSNTMYRFNPALHTLIINPGSGIVIEGEAFNGCSNLANVTLPDDIAEIRDVAFCGTAIKNIIVPNGKIEAFAFANCNLENIILGAGVESIGREAFDGSNAINAVYATPTTPPDAENNTFSYYEAQLYVPEEAIDTYYNFTRCWYRFSGKPLVMPDNIEVSGPTTISGEEGETFQLTATITPSNVTLDRVMWRSTNPAIASVDNNGLVTIHNFTTDGSKAKAANTVSCQIIATTLYADSPVAMVTIETNLKDAAIEYINSDNINGTGQQGNAPNDIFTLQGVCLKRNASQSDIDALAPGIYIIAGKKVIVK